MERKYIFVSYAHKDGEQVLPMISALRSAGYEVWYDEGIEAGTEWPEYIGEKLVGCSLFLACISENAMESINCRNEIHLAISKKKEMLVAYLEKTELSPGMELQLGSMQAIFRYRHASEESFFEEMTSARILRRIFYGEEPPKDKKRASYLTAALGGLSKSGFTPEQREVKKKIEALLESFKIKNAEIVSAEEGPTVTRYALRIEAGVPVRKIMNLKADFALALGVMEVRLVPDYGQGLLCVEVPKKDRKVVTLGELLFADEYTDAPSETLTVAMGQTALGENTYGELSKMVHILVGGATGMGKSRFLHGLLISLIAKYTPKELQFLLLDPKTVEFMPYAGLPHLLAGEVLTDLEKGVRALQWVVGEINRRYELFKSAGNYCFNIDKYNAQKSIEEKLPKIVVVIDELADYMALDGKTTEKAICAIAQKARAAGVHLILATARPSADVITGMLKANIPTRVAFRVSTAIDSNLLLDTFGAENLLTKGDYLWKDIASPAPKRMQAPYVSDSEMESVIEFVKKNNEPNIDQSAVQFLSEGF